MPTDHGDDGPTPDTTKTSGYGEVHPDEDAGAAEGADAREAAKSIEGHGRPARTPADQTQTGGGGVS
jgi:hypothetical protein